MPIPEPGLWRPSNLTPKQQQEQLAACYGVSMPQPLTAVEAEQMRSLLQRYDSEHKPIQVHNINDPPKTPYRFQEFPQMVYNHQESAPAHNETRTAIVGSSVLEETVHVRAHVEYKIVKNAEELREALDSGWSVDPPEFREEPEYALSASNRAEVERAEATLVAARKRGRPRLQEQPA